MHCSEISWLTNCRVGGSLTIYPCDSILLIKALLTISKGRNVAQTPLNFFFYYPISAPEGPRRYFRKIRILCYRTTHFDVWNTHTQISFADTTTRITPYDMYPLPWIPTTGKSEKNLWLSEHAFVILRIQYHRERSGVRVLLDSNQLSPVSSGACVQATQTLLWGMA